jgi:diguanylate cyclase (GGDEF)-like protein/PAS domain S-box-containing protein
MVEVVKEKPQKVNENLTQDALGHSRNLLLALSRAAQSIQRAHSAEEVYHAVGDQIKSLGGEVSLFMLDDQRQTLTVAHTSYAPNSLQQTEELTGISALAYRFTLDPNGIYARDINASKAIYVQNVNEYVTAMLPPGLHLFATQIAGILKLEQGIVAPLRVEDESLGLMVVSGLSLNEDDIPAMESFAGQIAVSLSNVRLTQKMQEELSARKRAEENSLLQSAALEAAANAIAITDVNGIIQWVNTAWVALTGYTKEESMGQDTRLIKSETHDPLFYTNMWQTILAGQVWRGEMTNRRRDGSLYCEEQTITPVLDGQGNVRHFIAIKLDITKRKQVEADLQQAREELEKANFELKAALEHEQHLAHTDALTGVFNRRHLFELAEHEFEVAKRYGHPLSVIMFDLDHFKRINDTLGHAMGDQILERVTQIACAELREVDLIGRYGGEEFLIILPVTGAQRAWLLAERIRSSVETFYVAIGNNPVFVTLSIGIAEMGYETQDGSVENLIHRADEAMYRAKRSGRNCTVIFDSD